MAFRVEIQPQALEDLDAIAVYIRAKETFEAAQKWFDGIMLAIATLKEMPARCPVAPESEELDREVRVLLYGRKNRRYKVKTSRNSSRDPKAPPPPSPNSSTVY